MTKKLFIFSVCIFFLLSNESTAEIIYLRGGAKVQGKILKKDDHNVFLDFGFDLFRIPSDQILKITKDNEDKVSIVKSKSKLYTEADLKVVSTVEAIEKYASSVLVIRTPRGLGSGFFINKEGYIITNFHVIKEQRHVSVTQFVGEKHNMRRVVYRDVRIVALDPFHDLAVLKIEKNLVKDFRPVVFATTRNYKLGETVFVIGNPLGLERTVTEGVISHLSRNFAGNLYLQIDAPVNPGNSGGPLFNSKGEVIGVINMGVMSMEGLNFAIPIRNVKFLLDNIDAYVFNENNPLSGYFYPVPPRKPGNMKNRKKEDKNNEKP